MITYKKLYFSLFNQITDTVEHMEEDIAKLKRLQILTEEMYMSMTEENEESEEGDNDKKPSK